MNRPIFRKKSDENYVFDMVDDYGRTWSRGNGNSRLGAIINARKNQPPAKIRRGILLAAKHHPIKAALLTATAYHTYQAINSLNGNGEKSSWLGVGLVAALAYLGIKILTYFVHDEDKQ